MDLSTIKKLIKKNNTKIVLIMLDGLGGLPRQNLNLTELECAKTPNLDKLAERSICGLQEPVGPGITPGSGPGHLGVFGYNPLKYQVGRGTLAALGIDFDLKFGDVAARGNFCTVDNSGVVIDRRAGRIPDEKNKMLCEILSKIDIPKVETFVKTVKEHRFLFVLRDEGLSCNISDTDPQEIGKKPLFAKALSIEAKKTSEIINNFINKAKSVLSKHHPANMILLRGFSERPNWPSYKQVFGLDSAAIAAYPMYRGLARLLDMALLDTGQTTDKEFSTLEKNWEKYEFFFLHIKATDSSGEDGDFDRKVRLIEEVDHQIPRLLNLDPDVVVLTGDHSTPAILKHHSWHPVPVLIYSKYCRPDNVKTFGERACISGGLGPRIPAVDLIPIALANAKRLGKFGA